MKYLKISPEYGTNPLWLKFDNEIPQNIDVNNTNFNSGLKNKISEWARVFDLTLNQDYPPESGFQSLEDEIKFENNGYSIWELIKEKYSNNFDAISYHSVILNKTFTDTEEYKKRLQDKLSRIK